MVRQQRAGRFLVSESKIKELAALNITSNSIERDPHYFKDIVNFVIGNSTITKLSKAESDSSRYGLVYKLKLHDGVPSPLVNLHLDSQGRDKDIFKPKNYKPVRTFLLKLSFLSLLTETSISNMNGKTSVLMTHFSKEAKFQNEAYDATYELGESVVPACISPAYYDLFVNKDVINPIFAKLLDESVDTDRYLEYLSDLAKSRHVLQFGLILMEYAEGFRTLDEINHDKTLSEEQRFHARMLAKMSHLLLHNKGILQGDSHEQNVMVNLDYQGFLTGPGKALVIDFGRARRLSGKLSDKKDEILNLINAMVNPPGYELPQYEWIKISKASELAYLDSLLDMHNEQIDLIATKYGIRHNITTLNRLRWKDVLTKQPVQTEPSSERSKSRSPQAKSSQVQSSPVKAVEASGEARGSRKNASLPSSAKAVRAVAAVKGSRKNTTQALLVKAVKAVKETKKNTTKVLPVKAVKAIQETPPRRFRL